MEGNEKNLDIITFLKRERKIANFIMGLKTRDEMIQYIVDQMERVEREVPEMVKHVDYHSERDFNPNR